MTRSMSALSLGLVAAALLGMQAAFVGPSTTGSRMALREGTAQGTPLALRLSALPPQQEEAPSSLLGSIAPFLAGLCLGVALLVSPSAVRAEVEDVSIPVDGKGKTTNLSKEQLVRGKRLFNAACSSCHVGGATRTNQNVGLSLEELSGAQPNRASVEGLVDYMQNPTTYDGLKEISEVHPSIKGADVWPKMRSMKQQDLVDMGSYVLYQNFTIPEKWGGGKQYY